MEQALRDTQLKILWVARIDYSGRNRIQKHVHEDYWQLFYFLEGQGELIMDEETLPLQEGHFYLFREGAPHGIAFTAASVTLDYKFRLLDSRLKQWIPDGNIYGHCSQSDLSDLKACYKLSIDNMRRPNPLLTYQIDSRFKSTLLSILQGWSRYRDGSKGVPALADHTESDFPIARYIRDNWNTNLTIAALAEKFGYHPNYLIRIFNQHTGVSPIQYLQEIRLSKAREYLEFSSHSISEIAELVGWSVPYFSKLFNEREGMPPSEYRAMASTMVGKDIVLEQEFVNEWQVTMS